MLKLRNQYFILRHGQTIYQTKKKKIIYPWPENPVIKLTKSGEKQIKTIAQKLKKIKVDLIFSSDIFRAKQTAKIIGKELGLKVKLDPRLREINFGIYHGQSKEKLLQDFSGSPQERFSKRFYKRLPKGESWQITQKRIFSFLKELDKNYQGKKILIVSHGDPLWLLEGAVKNWPLQKFLENSNYIKTSELRKL